MGSPCSMAPLTINSCNNYLKMALILMLTFIAAGASEGLPFAESTLGQRAVPAARVLVKQLTPGGSIYEASKVYHARGIDELRRMSPGYGKSQTIKKDATVQKPAPRMKALLLKENANATHEEVKKVGLGQRLLAAMWLIS